MRLYVTDEDLVRIATALCHYSDMLAEMTDDTELRTREPHVHEWADHEGHDVERLHLRVQTLAHTVQAAQAMANGNHELAAQRAVLAGKALADYERMTV
jgi:hypothetical protein